jgi:hypothetical protein
MNRHPFPHWAVPALLLVLAPGFGCGGDAAGPDTGATDVVRDVVPPDDDGPRDVADDGTGLPDGARGDVGDDAGGGLVPAGGRCRYNDECDSGFCVPGPSGYECAARCDEGCPVGTSCLPVTPTGMDLVSVCVPDLSLACTPCVDDGGCGGARCLAVDGTLRCLSACDSSGHCPDGFTCGAHPDAGQPVCLPATGSCDCDASRAGTERLCANAGDAGTCFGTETCRPDEGGWVGCSAPAAQPEVCDGLDNDCSGAVDDSLPVDQTCTREVEGVGVCEGPAVCAGASGWTCLAPEPALETCDYVDNDCDGEVDEDFRTDGEYAGQQHCGACGVDCDLTVANASSACDGTGAVPVCVVVACDPGYYPVNRYACASVVLAMCQPCVQDEDCAAGICREIGDGGSWCTRPCGTGQEACPDGYACVEGVDESVCSPVSGTCDCRPGVEGARRPCSVTNAVGTCHGVELCDPLVGWGVCTAAEPSAETCNGLDDDCNGTADDGLTGGEPCERTGAEGTCTGVTACMGAAGWTCTAAEPEAERCDGFDNDCDGTIDEEGAAGCVVRYRDGDGDGAGVTATGRCLCGPEGDLAVTIGGDCDDDDPDVSPLAFESCNGVDDDCDGVADQPGTPGCALYFADADGDGWGSDADVSCLCQPDLVHVLASGGDCNDASAAANPDRDEVCDGLDNDCDGITDEEGATGCFAHYRDADGDGAGDASDPRCLCGPVPPYTATTGDDCSDRTAAIGPQATELCNGFDDDCDGTIDEEGATGCLPTYVDADGDGYGAAGSARCLCAPDGQHVTRVGGDCDDGDDGVHPGVEEACNGVDDDCDGEVDEVLDGDPIATGCVSRFLDQDGDGFGDPAAAPRCTCGATGPTPYTADNADDCDDAVATTHPGASEACNGVDDDCDGTTDVGEFADLVGPGWAIDYQDDDGDGIANCVDPCPVFVDRAPPQNTTAMPGSTGNPWPSIQPAIDGSGTCDRVLVHPGTYVENVRFNGHEVRLESVSGPTVTTIDGNRNGATVTFDQGESYPAALVGFRVTGGSGNAIYSLWKEVLATPANDTSGGGIFVKAASPLIQGNVVVGNDVQDQGGGIFLYASYAHVVDNQVLDNIARDEHDCGAGILSTNSEALIERNFVRGNQCTGSSGDGAGLMAYATSDHIRGNVFTGNWARNNGSGVRLSYYGEVLFEGNLVYGNTGQGVMVSHGTTGRVVNNTIVDNSTYGLYIFISSGSVYSAPQIANNIIAYNDGCGVSDNSDSPFTFTNNDTYSNGTNYCGNLGGSANPTGRNGNLSTSPGFVAWSNDGNFANDDFRLRSDSACRNAGTDVVPYGVVTDHDGNPRKAGSATDIGAFEYVE